MISRETVSRTVQERTTPMTESRAARGRYLFKVSEYSDGSKWISLEPRYPPPPELTDFVFGFDLAPRIDMVRARAVAKFMNDNLNEMSLTTLSKS
jgi:hypothetical protein